MSRSTRLETSFRSRYLTTGSSTSGSLTIRSADLRRPAARFRGVTSCAAGRELEALRPAAQDSLSGLEGVEVGRLAAQNGLRRRSLVQRPTVREERPRRVPCLLGDPAVDGLEHLVRLVAGRGLSLLEQRSQLRIGRLVDI